MMSCSSFFFRRTRSACEKVSCSQNKEQAHQLTRWQADATGKPKVATAVVESLFGLNVFVGADFHADRDRLNPAR
jgi:hypothetical protein